MVVQRRLTDAYRVCNLCVDVVAKPWVVKSSEEASKISSRALLPLRRGLCLRGLPTLPAMRWDASFHKREIAFNNQLYNLMPD